VDFPPHDELTKIASVSAATERVRKE
jgi:hypothetical protein